MHIYAHKKQTQKESALKNLYLFVNVIWSSYLSIPLVEPRFSSYTDNITVSIKLSSDFYN